jgi:hypothetical protein
MKIVLIPLIVLFLILSGFLLCLYKGILGFYIYPFIFFIIILGTFLIEKIKQKPKPNLKSLKGKIIKK